MKHIISTEDGTIQAINTQAPPKTHSHVVAANAASIPTTAHPRCTPIASLDPRLLRSISQINYLLTTRPIWTRRGLLNCLPEHNIRYLAKHAIPYCGYHFRNGPWRDCIVKFGVDPRTSPDYRRYQTLIFKLDRTTAFGSNAPAVQGKGKKSYVRPSQNKPLKDDVSHIFDGHSVSKDGKTWAICDITDTFLANILSTKNIRETCDVVSDGWYHNGTLAKVRVIMRAKIQRILEGREYSDVEFGRLLAIPESITSENKKGSALIPKGATSEELFWASRIRSAALVRFDAAGKKVRMDGEADSDHVGGGNEDDGLDVEGEELGGLEDYDEDLGGDDGNGDADEEDPDEIMEDDDVGDE
jgi:general transcription factor 3C polypeptide 5 (transcription factor C subunit 1)